MPDRSQLNAMITGFRLSAALGVAAELGISDLLADGPRTLAELAAATSSHEDTLYRLMRALATVGAYDEQDGRWSVTELGEGLRSDVPGTLRPLARTLSSPALWAAYGHLGHSVHTGENAFQARHGVDIWEHRRDHPDENSVFNDNMTALTSVVADSVASSYDFADMASVVDVGGGQGILLEAVLTRHPHLTGTVFDLAHVVAQEPRTTDLAPRWGSVAGSFFDEVPHADAYLLKSIIHDWPDERCVDILRVCRAGLNPGGAVLLVEVVLGRPGYEKFAAFSDLNMLVMAGGRERTEEEHAALFAAAGLRLTRVIHTPSRSSIVEARLAD
jgi:O-methyltransferase domain/Dimerisation domain